MGFVVIKMGEERRSYYDKGKAIVPRWASVDPELPRNANALSCATLPK